MKPPQPNSGDVPPTTGACAVGSSADPFRDRRGAAPPKRGETASEHIHLRAGGKRKSHYVRFAKKHTEDKTLTSWVFKTLDKASGYTVRNENDPHQRAATGGDE